jgi:hypothetical protein
MYHEMLYQVLQPYSAPVALLGAGQHSQPTPPDDENPQLRPVTLDKLLSRPCIQLIVTAEGRREGGWLHMVKHSLFEMSGHKHAALT